MCLYASVKKLLLSKLVLDCLINPQNLIQWISVALRNPVTRACCVLWINVCVDFDLTMNIISTHGNATRNFSTQLKSTVFFNVFIPV